MTSDWYFKQNEQVQGPYSFQDLVDLAREDKLGPDTLVRAGTEADWQRADSVSGLLEQGDGDPGAEAETDLVLANAGDLETFLTAEEAAGEENAGDSEPMNSSSMEASAEDTADETDDEAETGAYSDETWSTTVKAAVDKIDSRNPQPTEEEEEDEPLQIVPEISLSFLQRPVFRMLILACILLLCASAGVYGFIQWMGEDQVYFPLVGETSPLLFLVYATCSFLVVVTVVPLLSYVAAPYLRVGYKLGAPLVTAGLTALFLLHWSKQQNLIFPTGKQAEVKLFFPLMGECSTFSYWMYFTDVLIFVAVLTFFAARWLESHADEA